MRSMSRAKCSWLGFAVIGLLACVGGVCGQEKQSSPLLKLDRNELTPLEMDMLPDAAVAVTRVGASTETVTSCAFSRDGKLVTGTREGKAVLWDLTGKAPRELQTIELDPQKGEVRPVRFSPDGKRLVAVQGGALALYDITGDGARMVEMKDLGIRDHVAFHPTKPLLLYTSGNVGKAVMITPNGIESLPSQMKGVNSGMSFSPDGNMFASVVFNTERNGNLYGSEIMFWKFAADISEFALIRKESGFKAVAYSPDGKWLATGSLDKFVRVWDLGPKQPVEKALFPVSIWTRDIHFVGGSDYVVAVSAGNLITLINVAENRIEKEWTFVPRRGSKFDVGAMANLISTSAMSPDGRHLAFSNSNPQTVILRLPVGDKP